MPTRKACTTASWGISEKSAPATYRAEWERLSFLDQHDLGRGLSQALGRKRARARRAHRVAMQSQHQQVGSGGLDLAEQAVDRRGDDHLQAVRHHRAGVIHPVLEFLSCLADRIRFDFGGRLAQGFRHVDDDQVFDDMNDVQMRVVPLSQAHGLVQRAARAVREVHADDDGFYLVQNGGGSLLVNRVSPD